VLTGFQREESDQIGLVMSTRLESEYISCSTKGISSSRVNYDSGL